jgi:DNA polymerase III subunit alpha
MKEILDLSHGVVTYQDDVLLIAIHIAGYSWLEADALRKAMGKKIPAEMEAQKEKLISGAIKNGMTPDKAEKLWKLIEPFAAYGFNKAHAASYGKVAYQTAYMKANFPVEYMTAVLTAEAGDVDTVSVMVNECKRMGIPVLPPSVNESFGDFTVILGAPDAIRFGLYSIKNFGAGIADTIITEREQKGRFLSLSDFLRRIKDRNLNRRSLEALIQCGALDDLGERGNMLANIELILEYHKNHAEEKGMDSLFSLSGNDAEDIRLPKTDEAPIDQKLLWEKELLGLYVSGHPLDKHAAKLASRSMNIAELKERLKPGMTGIVAGLLEEVKPILTKGGDQMARS